MSYLRGRRAVDRSDRAAVRAPCPVDLSKIHTRGNTRALIDPNTYDDEVASLLGLKREELLPHLDYVLLCAMKGYAAKKCAALLKLKLGR